MLYILLTIKREYIRECIYKRYTAPHSVCKPLIVKHLSYIVPCFGTFTGMDCIRIYV